ncbi:redoxin domain-containing protein [Rhodovulum euryhalinum]|uniref:Alkyl hydroperoxide reductase C n=1 Tax=Rhodovulum euryhalinum TaxID=35805 RepID=A0A4R2K8N3_9RHOB|nr:redoxin domain-containing protein [Rhodovulum euryhalinum]TCO68307.1 peroxiredoxin (alkyl hydroperoxide reductase subunit C) [Rhodovulum euryhalinum]
MSIFHPSGPQDGAQIALHLPRSYRMTVPWLPRIGDIFPDFSAPTTKGPLDFHAWAETGWTVLFGQPGAFTPVCTTELASFAAAQGDFAGRGTRLIGLCVNTCTELEDWCTDIGRIFGVSVDFPMIGDRDGMLAEAFGMHHPKDAGPVPIRKTFILDPALHVRMILSYPARIGRNTEETLRILDALQAQDRLDVATPADWVPGADFLVPASFDRARADAVFGDDWTEIRPYLRVVNAQMHDPASRPGNVLRPPTAAD